MIGYNLKEELRHQNEIHALQRPFTNDLEKLPTYYDALN